MAGKKDQNSSAAGQDTVNPEQGGNEKTYRAGDPRARQGTKDRQGQEACHHNCSSCIDSVDSRMFFRGVCQWI